MTVRAAAQDLRTAVPVESEELQVVVCGCVGSLQNRKWCLLIPHVPELELSIECARDEHVLCAWVDLDLGDASVVALESLAQFRLCLSQIVQFHDAIFVATEDKLVLIREVGVECGDHLVVSEDTGLSKELLGVKDLQLVVGAASD